MVFAAGCAEICELAIPSTPCLAETNYEAIGANNVTPRPLTHAAP